MGSSPTRATLFHFLWKKDDQVLVVLPCFDLRMYIRRFNSFNVQCIAARTEVAVQKGFSTTQPIQCTVN